MSVPGRRRRPNGASSVYKSSDGWHGRVTVGVRDDGKPDRRHVRGQTQAVVLRKVRELEQQREQGTTSRSGRQPYTVAQWLKHWVEEIAAPSVRENTADGYRVAVYTHLLPALGAHRLDRLEPEHLERFYALKLKSGSSPATVHQSHRTIRTALGEAIRRGHVARNAAALAKPPRLSASEIEPFTIQEVRQLLCAARTRRNSARWAVALALGLRQGEALGLKWEDVDLDGGSLRVRRSRLRPRYEHGCAGRCGRASGYCPQRRQVRPDADETKSRAGRRVVGLPSELVVLLQEHRAAQEEERRLAGAMWEEGDWMFANAVGTPINPNTDYRDWKSLLAAAGLRDARLHDARHTAATVLLILGVPERAVMGIMGWSSTAMTARYQHVTDAIRRDVAQRVGELIWSIE